MASDQPEDPLGRVPCQGAAPGGSPCQGGGADAGEQEGDGEEGVLPMQQPGEGNMWQMEIFNAKGQSLIKQLLMGDILTCWLRLQGQG